MPIYEYVCSTCRHKFDKIQPMGADGAECPRCEQPAQRAISLFSATSTGEGGEPAPVAGMGGACCSGGACSCSM